MPSSPVNDGRASSIPPKKAGPEMWDKERIPRPPLEIGSLARCCWKEKERKELIGRLRANSLGWPEVWEGIGSPAATCR